MRVVASEPVEEATELVLVELARGRPVVLPTDTVYGLAAPAADEAMVAELFRRKGRGSNVPVAVLVADVGQGLALWDEPEDRIGGLLDEHWPGGLTVVARRRPDLDWQLGGDGTTIGVRCPGEAIVRQVAARIGPLAVTSANRHGEPTPATVEELGLALGPDLLAVDAGRRDGSPSTVLDLSGPVPLIHRVGAMPVAALERRLGPLARPD